MICKGLLLLVAITYVNALPGFGMGPGFGPVLGGGVFQNQGFQTHNNMFSEQSGSAESAGQANAFDGEAMSMNDATHEAGSGFTRSSGTSSNFAGGFMPSASGAAQAGGGVSSGSQSGTFAQNDMGFFRRKRQIGFPNMFNGGFGGGFGGFGSSRSNANSLGGASADIGDAWTNNNAFTNSDPFGASGSAFGNAGASGVNPNAWNAASSSSFSNGFRR